MVKALAQNLEEACKEEISKEAIAEAWTTGVLQFQGVKTLKSGYHSCDFVDGNLVLSYKLDSVKNTTTYFQLILTDSQSAL